MKRSDKTEKSGLFGNLGQKKKPVVGEESAPKTIRHIERPVKLPFLADMEAGKEQYGSAEDMEDKWGLNEKQATLTEPCDRLRGIYTAYNRRLLYPSESTAGSLQGYEHRALC